MKIPSSFISGTDFLKQPVQSKIANVSSHVFPYMSHKINIKWII